MIADYQFYAETYMGDMLPEESFTKYANRADSYLSELTMGRYNNDSLSDSIKEAVKMAECACAEQIYIAEQAAAVGSNAAVASESVGRHSVSYRSGAEIQQQTAASIRQIVQRYLGITGLLYRGIPYVHAAHNYSDYS